MAYLSDNAQKALNIVGDADEFAYDVETSGLDWKFNYPVGYVINEFYVPIRHGGGGNLNDPTGNTPVWDTPKAEIKTPHPFELELAKAMASRRGKAIGHHLKFDMHMSANAGVIIGPDIADTQITESLLDELAGSYSLEMSCKRRGVEDLKLGQEMYNWLAEKFGGQPNKNQMENFWRLPGTDHMAMAYAGGDGKATLQLHNKQKPLVEQEELGVVWQLEQNIINIVFEMERKGIRVDLARAEELIEVLGAKIIKAREGIVGDINVRSSAQIKRFLESQGRTDWPTTDKGNPSFTEAWLKDFSAGREILFIRKHSNMINTFIRPLIDTHVFKGRVHTSFNQMKFDDYGTISGRFSSSNPNVQQVPKRNKDLGRAFRSLFIPDDGYTFFEADYSQCEPRLFAHYSEDQALVDGYNANPPKDVHHVVSEMLAVERDPTAKRMNMGIFTGMQPRSFAGHMGWDLPRATEKFNDWMRAFPGVPKFQNLAKNVFKRRGYVKTLLGRRCRLDHPRFAYRGTSRIIQGGNADIIKYKLWQGWEFSQQHEIDLFLTIHDSFGGQFPTDMDPDKFGELVDIWSSVQDEPFNLIVPFTMDVGCGNNWGEATYGPE